MDDWPATIGEVALIVGVESAELTVTSTAVVVKALSEALSVTVAQ
jgi:uncharacterized membrane protein YjjP (DUF1212 family)